MAEDNAIQDQPDANRIGKWIRIGLVVSLGLNIFLGGFVAARMLGPKPQRVTPEIVGLNLRDLPQGLSQEVREDLEDSMRDHQREIRRAYKDYRDQQREINQLLREEKLNEQAVERAYVQLRRLNAEVQGPMQRALVDAIRKMDTASRRQFIELRELPRVGRIGRPENVDGARWRFEWKGEDGFQLDFDDHDMVFDFYTEDEDPEDAPEEETVDE